MLHRRQDEALLDRVDAVADADLERAAGRLGVQRGLRRQSHLRDPLAVAHDERALHHVPQLAHVAGPAVALEPLDRGRRERFRRARALVELGEEVLGEELDVLDALAQRRHVQREHLQAVEEIAPQLAGVDGFVRVAVARSQHANVGLDRLVGSDAAHRARLEHAQELHLEVRGHLGDFVEEQGSAVRALEEPAVLAVRPGEAALLVPEELAFDELRRDRAAVHREKRLQAAPAHLVDGLRDDFLAGAALAGDEDRRPGGRDALQLVVEALHGRRRAHETAEPSERPQLVAQARDFGAKLGRSRHARKHAAQMRQIDRLQKIVARAPAYRLDRALERRVSGDHDHFGRGAAWKVAQQLHAVAIRQDEVEKDDVRRVAQAIARLGERGCRGCAEALVGHQLGQPRRSGGVVVDDQCMRHLLSARRPRGGGGNREARGCNTACARVVPFIPDVCAAPMENRPV